ncbi:angiopoietin-4-like [Ostrea edulis]|uniref:angiopoietin-4-like n=1 Tax=Ostrea edulis TaxID=37623 RepID=UPI0024AFF4D3|nr:angiopoietin-4-like [Ostrea edulis]
MEILQNDADVKDKDGVYSINVNNREKSVYCDMTTDGGGLTAIQKRQDNSTDFYRTWADYKRGFGDPSTNYWIGNDAIHYMTKTNQELRVEMLSFDDEKAYALYSTFQVGNESSKYQLTVSGYSGTAVLPVVDKNNNPQMLEAVKELEDHVGSFNDDVGQAVFDLLLE